jgi:hypothetical protein
VALVASELYRQSGRHLSAKLVPTFANRGQLRNLTIIIFISELKESINENLLDAARRRERTHASEYTHTHTHKYAVHINIKSMEQEDSVRS